MTLARQLGILAAICALGAVGTLTGLYYYLAHIRSTETAVNFSVRQRLGAYEFYLYASELGTHGRTPALSKALARYEHVLRALEGGGEVDRSRLAPAPPSLSRQLAAVRAEWDPYRRALVDLMQSPDGEVDSDALAYVQTHTRTLIDTVDELVSAYQDIHEDQRQLLGWLLASAGALFAALGIAGAHLLRKYISRRTAEEQRLKDSEERFHELAEHLRQVFYIRDLATDRMLYVSPAYEKIWGRPLGGIYADPSDFVSSIHPDDKEGVMEMRSPRLGERPFDGEFRILRSDGEIRWIAARSFPMGNARGETYRIAGIAEDITERKEAEDALRESEQRYRMLVERMTEGMGVVDERGVITFVNRRAAHALGYEPEELVGRPAVDLVAPDQREHFASRLTERRQGSRHSYELSWKHRKGDILQTLVSPEPVTGKNGVYAGSFAVLTDITALKRTEDALRRKRDFAERLIATAPAVVLVLNMEGCIVRFNPWMEKLSGYLLAEVRGRDWFETFVPLADRQRIKAVHKDTIAGAQTSGTVNPIVTKSGELRIIEWHNTLLRDAAGKATGVLSVGQDMTEHVAARQALARSEAKYRALMAHASDAILLAELDGRLIEANQRALELLGYEEAEIRGLQVRDIHPHEELTRVLAHFHEMVETGATDYLDGLVLRKDGSTVPVDVRATTIEFDGQRIAQGIFRDIRPRKELEDKRIAYERTQRETLVREVHHRIKNNLQGVVGLLRRQVESHPEGRESLEGAITQVSSMAIVHGLQGKRTSNVVQLCDLVTEICRATAGLTWAHIVPTVAIEVPRPVKVATNEAVPIALILNELVFNAVKHGEIHDSPQQVTVSLTRNDAAARVRIHNAHASLPADFDFDAGRGLGTGLTLLQSLLPPKGARLSIYNAPGGVTADLELGSPVIEP